jgi:DNA-binding IclR family transcriptional regulator
MAVRPTGVSRAPRGKGVVRAGEKRETGMQKKYESRALDKAFQILDVLASNDEGLTISETARALGLTVGKIYRFMVSLSDSGFISKDDGSDRYQLTVKLFEIALRRSSTSRLLQVSQLALDTLAKDSLQSCHLSVRFGDEALIIAKADSPVSPHLAVNIGSRFSLHETMSGIVLLAHSTEADVERYLAGLPSGDRAETRRRVKAVVEAGHAMWPSDVVSGVTNMACPVRDYTHRTVAALTIPYLASKRSPHSTDAVLLTLRACALRVSSSLGYNAPES